MPEALFRFYGELNDFLPASQRQKPIPWRWKVGGSLKDMIEGLGVPHPEIDLILINGHSVGFQYRVQDGEFISVYPPFRLLDIEATTRVRPEPLSEPRFVLDAHLGKLATYLRMIGVDTLYRNDYDDETLARISCQQRRILLTRDQKLLMRNAVTYGYWVRSIWPKEQLREVVWRYNLANRVHPLTRCLRCNAELRMVSKAEITHRLETNTRRYYDRFWRCPDCERIYWKGSHYQRMTDLVTQLLQEQDRESTAQVSGQSQKG